jgi:hypothetical protein
MANGAESSTQPLRAHAEVHRVRSVKLARVRVPERAQPTVALACDGALYDVASLERCFGAGDGGGDFFERVIAARSAGLEPLEARLLSGRRPSEARIPEGVALVLPPCDPSRSMFVQFVPCSSDEDVPAFRLRDARALVGDGQPALLVSPGSVAEVGLAVVVGEDLERASAIEAERALLGYTLLVDWVRPADAERVGPPTPAHLGPYLVTGPGRTRLDDLRLVIEGEGAPLETCAFDPGGPEPGELVAYLSHHVSLRAGDVVGLGAPARARVPRPGDGRLSVTLPRTMTLVAWSVEASIEERWRRPTKPPRDAG